MLADHQGHVTQMDPNEVILFNLYQHQASAPHGRDREDLPYTAEFEQLRQQYNQVAGKSLSQREFWLLLKGVLKYGTRNIKAFLQSRPGSSPGTNAGP